MVAAVIAGYMTTDLGAEFGMGFSLAVGATICFASMVCAYFLICLEKSVGMDKVDDETE